MNTELTTQRSDIFAAINSAPKLAESTKRKYRIAVKKYLATGAQLTDSQALTAYARDLSKSGRGFLKAAIRLWSKDLELEVKGQATPENVNAVQASVYRLEALNGAIKVEEEKGQKTHTWLSRIEVRKLLATCDTDIVGQRDKLVLGLLTGAGLRREELANLTWADIKTQPVGDKVRTVLAIKGKGKKNRTIPISDRLAAALDRWADVVGREGYVVRSLGMNREPKESISAMGLFNIVNKAGRAIGKDELAPHDLRRTYAQLGYEAGIPITQISVLLGHASVATTQRYLDLKTDLETTISDFIPFD